jgi:hypothetical protein
MAETDAYVDGADGTREDFTTKQHLLMQVGHNT